MRYSVRHVFEYLLARSLAWVFMVLPYRAALFLGWLIALFVFRVLGFRVRLAKQRLRIVFGDRFSERDIRRIAWVSWRNFVFCVVDLVRLPAVNMGWIESHVTGWESVREKMRGHCATRKGAILACPHMGAWEMAGVAMQVMDFPIFFLTGRQKNPLVDAYLNRLRGRTGIDTVQRGSAMLKGVLRRLKDGGILAFLPDVRTASDGVKVRFLGGEANVPAGMALFARQTQVPIFPSLVTRVGWSGHALRVFEPVWPDQGLDKRDDWQRMTQAVFTVIEEQIRNRPEQWFWFNKRWILDPL